MGKLYNTEPKIIFSVYVEWENQKLSNRKKTV
jgi:hypothetical protein